MYLIYMYNEDLALNNLQWLICHKTQPNHNKEFEKSSKLLWMKMDSNQKNKIEHTLFHLISFIRMIAFSFNNEQLKRKENLKCKGEGWHVFS